jgi:hypothetical protein
VTGEEGAPVDPLSLGVELGSEVVVLLVGEAGSSKVGGEAAGGVGTTGAVAFGSEPEVIFVPRRSAAISACASATVSHVSLISIVIRPFLLQ